MKRIIVYALFVGIFLSSCKKDTSKMNEKIIKTNGVEICTESFGSEKNPAILLVAGATVSMLFWDADFCQQLAEKGFFVIRYDNRDVGKSTFYKAGTTPYNIVDLTDDAISILDGYNIKKAHFMGMSLGGLIAQIAAIKYPNRVKSLVLMSSGPWGDSDPTIPEMDKRILDFHSKSSSVDWTKEDSVVNYLIQGAELMCGRKPFNRQRSEQLIRAEFKRAKNYLSMFNHATLQGGEQYWNRLHEIKQPTFVIHGTNDKIWHFKHTGVLLDRIKGAKLLTLDGTGHELHFDDWAAIINGLTDHIRRNE